MTDDMQCALFQLQIYQILNFGGACTVPNIFTSQSRPNLACRLEPTVQFFCAQFHLDSYILSPLHVETLPKYRIFNQI